MRINAEIDPFVCDVLVSFALRYCFIVNYRMSVNNARNDFLRLRLNVITSYFKEMDNYEKRYN
jgi:hypothetical protein